MSSSTETALARPRRSRRMRQEGRLVGEGGARPQRILVAEDELEMRRLVADTLRRAGYEVVEARNGGELLESLTSWLVSDAADEPPFDLVISDHRMPGFTGLGVLDGLRHFEGAPPFILITAFGGSEFAAEAQRAGASAVLDKPFELRDLIAIVRRLLGTARS